MHRIEKNIEPAAGQKLDTSLREGYAVLPLVPVGRDVSAELELFTNGHQVLCRDPGDDIAALGTEERFQLAPAFLVPGQQPPIVDFVIFPAKKLEFLVVLGAERAFDRDTCSAMGMDLDGLLAFLEARDKVRIKSGVVYPGGAPACGH